MDWREQQGDIQVGKSAGSEKLVVPCCRQVMKRCRCIWRLMQHHIWRLASCALLRVGLKVAQHVDVVRRSVVMTSSNQMTLWPSGLRRNVKAVVFIGVGSNPIGVNFAHFYTFLYDPRSNPGYLISDLTQAPTSILFRAEIAIATRCWKTKKDKEKPTDSDGRALSPILSTSTRSS